ncbi:MAG TPA: hypothetical protein PLI45_00190 [Candidatus Woesebacteria bacterium]|nr:hypothetical protein [Candidatus Woesebacteria bacterium]
MPCLWLGSSHKKARVKKKYRRLILISEKTKNIGEVYASFTDPAFIKEHGKPVNDGKVIKYIIRTTVKTRSLGEILMASSCVGSDARETAIPYLLFDKRQLLLVVRMFPEVKTSIGYLQRDWLGRYAYHPTEDFIEKIVSL